MGFLFVCSVMYTDLVGSQVSVILSFTAFWISNSSGQRARIVKSPRYKRKSKETIQTYFLQIVFFLSGSTNSLEGNGKLTR